MFPSRMTVPPGRRDAAVGSDTLRFGFGLSWVLPGESLVEFFAAIGVSVESEYRVPS